MTTQFPLSGPMSVGDLLDRAFRLYRARFGVFLLTAAIFLGPVGVISAVVLMSVRDFSLPFLVPRAIMSILNGQLLSITDHLVVLVALFAHGFVTLALSVQSIEMLHSCSLTVGESIHRGTRRLWSYMGMTILKWSAVIAATAVAFVPVFIGFGFLNQLIFGLLEGDYEVSSITFTGMEIAFFIGLTALLALLFAPSVYLLSRWLVAPAALIAEGLGPIGSLRRSWQLSRGHTWRMIGYTMLLVLLIQLFNYALAILLQMAMSAILPDLYLGLQTGLVSAVHSIMSIVSVPIYTGAVVLLYYDLRIRSENYDLVMRVADLEEQVSRNAGQDMP